MQLATVKDSKPWSCSVWYASDERWNLYYISKKDRRHSHELATNPHVAGSIVVPHVKGSGEKVRGLQFEGIASATKGDELAKAHKLYLAKFPLAEDIPLALLRAAKFIATYYVVRPSVLVLFDEVNFPNQLRQEVKLS